jgi:hypothetical protein
LSFVAPLRCSSIFFALKREEKEWKAARKENDGAK